LARYLSPKSGFSNESAGELAFIYDRTGVIQMIILSPAYVTQQEATGGYHLEMFKGEKYLWSLGGSYRKDLG
jgi:hypothetical protein